MILALDVGNTNILAGCIDGGQICFRGRLSTDRLKTDFEYAVLLKNMLEIGGIDIKKIDGAVLSSVVPPIDGILQGAVKAAVGCDMYVINSGSKTDMPVRIDNSAQLGNDLLVGAVAALAEYKAPLIIFDLGTATTISVVDGSGAYIGGVIIPGIKVSQAALSGGTAKLPYIDLDAPSQVIGKNTVDCMKSGAVYATACMMDGMAERIEEELGEKAGTVVATGGLAKMVLPYCRRDIVYDDDLLLKGMRIIYEKNKK